MWLPGLSMAACLLCSAWSLGMGTWAVRWVGSLGIAWGGVSITALWWCGSEWVGKAN